MTIPEYIRNKIYKPKESIKEIADTIYGVQEQNQKVMTKEHDDMLLAVVTNKISLTILIKEAQFIIKPALYSSFRERENTIFNNMYTAMLRNGKIEWEIKLEYPIRARNGYIIGYIDILAFGKGVNLDFSGEKHRPFTFKLVVEIKSKIDNIGELIRHVNKYKMEHEMDECLIYYIVARNVTEEQRTMLDIAKINIMDYDNLKQLIEDHNEIEIAKQKLNNEIEIEKENIIDNPSGLTEREKREIIYGKY